MDKLKSPSLILLIISLIYSAIVGVNYQISIVLVGLVGLYAIEQAVICLNMYLESKKVKELPVSELDKLRIEIMEEEARARLEKIKRRETNVIGFNKTEGNNLTF